LYFPAGEGVAVVGDQSWTALLEQGLANLLEYRGILQKLWQRNVPDLASAQINMLQPANAMVIWAQEMVNR
jgi:hypothetical protein